MKNAIQHQLKLFSDKVQGYNMLFNYRLMNLCVKAELAALMPVTVVLDNREFNLEETAEIRRPDEYHLEIRPNNQEQLDDITLAIFDVHPEFILDIKEEENLEGKKDKYAYYSMPEVNKDRYDTLNNLTKGFYNECAANIDLVYARQQKTFVEGLINAPVAESDEAKDELKKIYDAGKDETVQIRDAKLKEIEEAYQQYMQGKSAEETPDDNANGFDVTQSMKILQN